MTGARPAQRVEWIALDRITVVNPRTRNKRGFAEIVDSIAQIGLKRPITVTRRIEADGPFYDLVCGQGRLEAYEALGQQEVPALVVTADAEDCLIASLVENCARRQHNAIDLLQDIGGMRERGHSPSAIARKTGLTIEYVNGVIRTKRNLLVGICPEAADLLKDRHVPIHVFTELRFMKAVRQVAAVMAMISMNRFSVSYAKSLVASTPDDELVAGRPRRILGLTEDQITTMQHESENVDREFRRIEQSYSSDNLDLMLATGYVNRLLGNVRVVRHLAQHHADILSEFQKLSDLQKAA